MGCDRHVVVEVIQGDIGWSSFKAGEATVRFDSMVVHG